MACRAGSRARDSLRTTISFGVAEPQEIRLISLSRSAEPFSSSARLSRRRVLLTSSSIAESRCSMAWSDRSGIWIQRERVREPIAVLVRLRNSRRVPLRDLSLMFLTISRFRKVISSRTMNCDSV